MNPKSAWTTDWEQYWGRSGAVATNEASNETFQDLQERLRQDAQSDTYTFNEIMQKFVETSSALDHERQHSEFLRTQLGMISILLGNDYTEASYSDLVKQVGDLAAQARNTMLMLQMLPARSPDSQKVIIEHLVAAFSEILERGR